MKLILALCFVWISPLICLFLRNEARFKKNIAVGVTLPYEGREDTQVQSRLKRYKAQQLWVCIALLLLMLPCLAAESVELATTLLCTWVLVCILVPYIPYVLCNRDLKAIKRERGWGPPETATVRVDTQAISTSKWLSPACFLIPLLVSLLPLIWDRELWVVYVVDAACIVLFWFCYRYLYRNKAEQVDGDLLLTRALTQVRRHNWGLMWLLCAALLAALNLVISLTYRRPLAMMLGILAVTVALVLTALGIELRTRAVQERLTASSGIGSYVDDDDKWIGGIFYYNPHDSHLIINSRVGTNSTINLARPAGKMLTALLAVLLLSIPFIMPITIAVVDQPPVLELGTAALTASSGSTSYQVSLDEITEVQLLETLPGGLVKVSGTNLSTLYTGRFTSSATGAVRVYLDPACPPFLYLVTEDGAGYLFGTRDTALTASVYEDLTAVGAEAFQ